MTMFIVKYIPTGKHTQRREVTFFSCDELKNGEKINITNVYKAFEEQAIEWGSYETRYAITNIEVKELKH